MRNNVTIHQCFSLIDTDDSQTISLDELKAALIRFNVGLQDKEIKIFLKRLDPDNKLYIAQNEFIQRFWSAYTYDDVFGDEPETEHPLAQVGKPPGADDASAMTSHNI